MCPPCPVLVVLGATSPGVIFPKTCGDLLQDLTLAAPKAPGQGWARQPDTCCDLMSPGVGASVSGGSTGHTGRLPDTDGGRRGSLQRPPPKPLAGDWARRACAGPRQPAFIWKQRW